MKLRAFQWMGRIMRDSVDQPAFDPPYDAAGRLTFQRLEIRQIGVKLTQAITGTVAVEVADGGRTLKVFIK